MPVRSHPHTGFGIGMLSKLTGVNIETIRYYERDGILPQPPRTEGGHRVYADDHRRRLQFVKRARQLGFTLAEVRGLLSLADGGDYTCGEVHEITLKHLDEVRRKIGGLRVMKRVLDEMAALCEGGTVPDCPIIDALYEPGND